MGTTIRTSISLLFLGALSYPFGGELKTGGYKAILLIAIGGGIIAGGFGIFCLYSALKTGQLSTVLTIAFCLNPRYWDFVGHVCDKREADSSSIYRHFINSHGCYLNNPVFSSLIILNLSSELP